jgi:hypothetical protein
VLEDRTLKPLPNKPATIGINGAKMLGRFLYFANTIAGILVRVEVDLVTGNAVGPYGVVADNLSLPDDMVLAEDGGAFVAGLFRNVVTEVSPEGSAKVIAWDLRSTDVSGATSAALGRIFQDRNTVLFMLLPLVDLAPQ